MERVIQIFPSHRQAGEADRQALSAMTPPERLDRAVALQAHYREVHGDIGQGLHELLALFHATGVDFLVVGGHAVAFHGRPRLTEDLDLFVRPDLENGKRIVQALERFGFGALDITPADFQAGDRVIQLGRAPNRVDLLTNLYGVDFAGAWSRRVPARLDDTQVWIISRDDLIRNKRETGRTQDLADAEFLEQIEP